VTYENIQIAHGNFTMDRSGSAFYTVDHGNGKLIKKSASGSVLFSFFLATTTLEVQSLQFDGYYYWTLERQGTAGFRVRKWEIGDDDLVRIVDEFSFISNVIDNYDTYAMAIEAYQDTLDNQEVVGETSFDVVDGGTIRAGDRIIIGPSTAVGFEGQYTHTTIISKVDKTVSVNPPLDATFSPNDVIVFNRSMFVFSDEAPGGLSGALYKFRTTDAFPLSLSVSNLYGEVRAATFFQGKMLFVRAGEVIWLDPDSLNIYRSQAIDNLNETRGEHRTVYDLACFSNVLYRLEQEHVYWNDSLDRYETEDWSPLYNYNTSGLVSEVYFVALKAEPPILHKSTVGVPAADLESEITVTVLDQFHTPIYNRGVNLSSTGGAISPTYATTDANGQIRATYTANSNVGDVTIQAEVT
jgi:hypothetical protein